MQALTSRESEVARLVASGRSNKAIGEHLSIFGADGEEPHSGDLSEACHKQPSRTRYLYPPAEAAAENRLVQKRSNVAPVVFRLSFDPAATSFYVQVDSLRDVEVELLTSQSVVRLLLEFRRLKRNGSAEIEGEKNPSAEPALQY